MRRPLGNGEQSAFIVLEQAPIYDENLAKIGPASPGEIIIIMIAGRNYNYNFDRAKI